jgi:hypothetical protein
VNSTSAPERRSRHVAWVAAAAIVVGVSVWLAARAFATDSCPEHDALRVVSSCRVLVGSLAIRVGAVAAVAVLLAEVLSSGLRRTAENIDEARRASAREGSLHRDSD